MTIKTILTMRLAVVLTSLVLASIVEADSERYQHWSEGVYFPPQNSTVESPINRNPPAQKRHYNPWAISEGGETQQQFPTAESLGYPSTDYNPYQSSAQGQKPPPGRMHTPEPRHHYPPAAAAYYSRRHTGPETDINAYSPEYERGAIGQGYKPTGSYPPAYGTETYYPRYGMGLYPRFSPLPLYGSSFFFLPDW